MNATEQLEPITATKRMAEIRAAWRIAGRFDHMGQPVFAGLWHPDNAENRHTLVTLVEVGNEVYGAGSHWLEEREA